MTLPWDEAETLRLWGRYLLQSHRREAAVGKLTESLTLYSALSAGSAWTEPIAADLDILARRGKASHPYPNGLSDREVDVLKLIAGGRTNREIAEQLFLSARTVERHIANIYGKIDVHSRTQATAYAFSRGLLPPPAH